MSRYPKVEIQKGEIKPCVPTLKSMSHAERVKEQASEYALRQSAQTMTLHTPKTSGK
jgi:hypothetical protein